MDGFEGTCGSANGLGLDLGGTGVNTKSLSVRTREYESLIRLSWTRWGNMSEKEFKDGIPLTFVILIG